MFSMKNKKYILKILIAFGMILPLLVTGQNTMQMGSATTGPNQNFSLGVSITNTDPFVAFQFDLPIPTGFSYVTGSAALNPVRSNGHVVIAQVITGNILRVMAYSPLNLPFLGNSGVVVTFQLKSGPVPGDYPLVLVGGIIGGTNQQNILTGTSNGTATVLAPDINLPITYFDFDRVPIGQCTTRNVTIQNTGNQALNILSITFDSPYFEVTGSTVFSIGAGQSADVTVKFNSLVKGVYDKVMTISSNDPDEPLSTVNLHARAYAVNELHTGNMNAFSGHQATLDFSINNMESFTGFQFDLTLPSPLAWIPGSAVLSSRKTDHVVAASLVSSGVLRVIAYSPGGQVFSGNSGIIVTLGFQVSGTGGYYPLNVSNVIIASTQGENILSDSYNGWLQIAAPDISCMTSVNFGDVSILDTGYQSLLIYNTGNDTLRINQVTFSNPAFSLLTTLPMQILPSQGKNLQLSFHQGTEGPASCTLKIYSNDPDAYENPLSVTLSAFAFIPNYMIVPVTQCKNGDTVRIAVNVSNLESFVGFQFDLGFPACMSYMPNSATLTSRAQDHIVISSLPDASHVRVMAFSMQQLPFTGDTGAIVRLKFVVNSSDPGYMSAPLILTNAILGDANSQNILYSVVNGSLSVRYLRTLSGIFTYNNTANTPLPSVKVILSENGIKIDSTNTDGNGHYLFPSVYDGDYRVKASWNAPWGGVNGTDALKVARHVVGLETLPTPIRKTAADVNASGTVSAMDILHIKKRFVGLESGFDRGDWVFERQSGGDTVHISGANTAVDFYGLCVGDVNGSHIPGNNTKVIPTISMNQDQEIFADAGERVLIPVFLSSDIDIGAISLDLEFPQDLLTIEDILMDHGKAFFNVSGNQLKMVWAEAEPLMASTGKPIFFIHARTTDLFRSERDMEFGAAPDHSEIADKTGEVISGISLKIPSVKFLPVNDDIKISATPNPTIGRFVVQISGLNTLTDVMINVYSETGESVCKPILTSLKMMELSLEEKPSGIYFIKVLYDNQVETLKIIKQ